MPFRVEQAPGLGATIKSWGLPDFVFVEEKSTAYRLLQILLATYRHQTQPTILLEFQSGARRLTKKN